MLLFPLAVFLLCCSKVLSGYCNVSFYFLGSFRLGVMWQSQFYPLFAVLKSRDNLKHGLSSSPLRKREQDWIQRTQCSISFSSPSPFSFLLVGGALARENEGLWRHRIFEFFDWLMENKEIISGSEDVYASVFNALVTGNPHPPPPPPRGDVGH